MCSTSVCAQHYAPCGSCARTGCVRDLDSATCRRFEPLADPEDALIAAALVANRGELRKARESLAAREAKHTVVELHFGLRRCLVLCVPHGESRAASAVYHSLFAARPRS